MPFAILLLVLFGLLLLVTPFLTIALFAREAKLRRQLNELAEENAKQHTKLQRAVGELQSKLAATPAPTTPPAEKPSSPEVCQPVSLPGSIPPLQAPAPTVASQGDACGHPARRSKATCRAASYATDHSPCCCACGAADFSSGGSSRGNRARLVAAADLAAARSSAKANT